jgi:hypothetical protein
LYKAYFTLSRIHFIFHSCITLLIVISITKPIHAQNFGNNNTRDTSANKTNNENWTTENAVTTFHTLNSNERFHYDTSISNIHRKLYVQPFYRDLGNLGSPIMNLQFDVNRPIGLSLGYDLYKNFRFQIDSLKYYQTDRPLSVFTYQMGTKLEQTAQIFHTQNINPNWNFAFAYRKTTSPGQYLIQRNNDDNAFFTSEFRSKSLRYKANFALAYNKQQHDENGGILADTFLSNENYSDKRAVPVAFYVNGYSNNRSPVTSMHRDVNFIFNQGFTIGKRDTLYNDDSTKYDVKLHARFRIGHQLKVTNQRFQFKDMRPDSLRYASFFTQSFTTSDSVYTQQNWSSFDNQFLLNGIMGKYESPITFTAGVGNRIDQFSTRFISNESKDNSMSNYLFGQILKEALKANQWNIKANATLFLTGSASGNFLLSGSISKRVHPKIGVLALGLQQQLNNAPYSYTTFQNQYWKRQNEFNKESSTILWGKIFNSKYNYELGIKNILVNQFLYFNELQLPDQYSGTLSVTQFNLRKKFYLGIVTLDNEFVFQQHTDGPINVPKFMGRHQLAIETKIFKKQLQIATGIEARYHSAYQPMGYSPLMNQFYYQNTYTINNAPDGSVFFNFRIKRVNAFLMLDHITQMWSQNQIYSKGYAAPNSIFRMGFNWGMVN